MKAKPEEKKKQTVADDLDALKHYVSMKETEIIELQADFERAREQLRVAEAKAQALEESNRKMVNQQNDLQIKVARLSEEYEERRLQYEKELKSREQENSLKTDKLLLLERKVEAAQKKCEDIKERVRTDIQKIRVREKDLEARLEILKRDSETLLASKDRKLLEFKRKMDALEYEIEILGEKEKAAQKRVEFWKARISRVLRAFKLGVSLLESDEVFELEDEETALPAKKSETA